MTNKFKGCPRFRAVFFYFIPRVTSSHPVNTFHYLIIHKYSKLPKSLKIMLSGRYLKIEFDIFVS